MAKAANKTTRRTRSRDRCGALSAQAAELRRQATALLSAPEAFWASLPGGLPARTALSAALERQRVAEQSLYSALPQRLEAMVRRQALDRDCWEFMALAREQLRPVPQQLTFQDLDSSPAKPAKFFPAGLKTQLFAIESLAAQLAAAPSRENHQRGLTHARAAQLSTALKTALAETQRTRNSLSRSVRNLRKATREISERLHTAQAGFWSALRSGDPRWLPPVSIPKTPFVPASAVTSLVRGVAARKRVGIAPECREEVRAAIEQTAAKSSRNPLEQLSIVSALAWLKLPMA